MSTLAPTRLLDVPAPLLEGHIMAYLSLSELCAVEIACRFFPESDALWFAHARRLLAPEILDTHLKGRHCSDVGLQDAGGHSFLRWKSVVASATTPVRRRWISLEIQSHSRFGHTTVQRGATLIVFGGRHDSECLNDVALFNLDTWTWSPAPMRIVREVNHET